MQVTRRSARTTRTRRGWPALVAASCLAGAACVPPTANDGDGSAPTPWEITPAPTVDDGTAYWPGAQWRTAMPGQVGMDSSAMATLSRGKLGEFNQYSTDWLRLIFSNGLFNAPGERWGYSSASAIVLGGILHAVTGEPADAYARHALFAPVGITRFAWATGQPNGLPHMGLGLSLTTPDLARIGYLMLRNGRWNDTPIVSDTWIAGMRERMSTNVGSWSTYSLDYGRMLWILPPIGGATGDRDVLAASGGGGQWILVVPGKDLVVVATGDAVATANFVEPVDVLYDIVVPATH